jgi:hypothetical protein
MLIRHAEKPNDPAGEPDDEGEKSNDPAQKPNGKNAP